MEEKKITYVEEGRDLVPGQGESEIPIITIESNGPKEHESEESAEKTDLSPAKQKKNTTNKFTIYFTIISIVILAILLFLNVFKNTINNYQEQKELGYSISVFPNENIQKLKQETSTFNQQRATYSYKRQAIAKPKIIKTTDIIANVEMNFYALQNLRAEITYKEPDTTDNNIYLYSRCADYHTDFSPCGSIVVNGKITEKPIGKRYGYCAMLQNNIIIGVSKQETIRDYIAQEGGHFFRQFVLISNGEVPKEFYLHGKVERRALARTIDENNNEQLIYVETVHKETLRDFANALRDYGFKDAIYITGGKSYSYYRSIDGKLHDVGDKTIQPHKNTDKVPWLVFKAYN